MSAPSQASQDRLKNLEVHLKEENPLLVEVVDGYRQLSQVGYALGLLDPEDSYANHISWWPLVSILGTFSAGKSTFINHLLSFPLQDTGNQAVDDKFTVICYSSEPGSRVLPGLALDADPRFPFYQTSEELEKVAPGQGQRIDAYLRLKTCNNETLKGRIFIDSPGFDADAQRSATLRLTNHIIDLSDLVLVFFDARHPEPGAMGDTLAHLVRGTIDRADSSKFMYVLNQMDVTAREDNPEEVIGAWQRALSREGLTAGRFYCIYNSEAAIPIEDEARRKRYEWKRDQDMAEITERIGQVSVERAYRIVGALEKRVRDISDQHIPELRRLTRRWRHEVLAVDLALLALVAVAWMAVGNFLPELAAGANAALAWLDSPIKQLGAAALAAVIAVYVHFQVRRFSIEHIVRRVIRPREYTEHGLADSIERAFRRNTRFWRSIFQSEPVGWNRRNRRRLKAVLAKADEYVQALNDRFTDPSGTKLARVAGSAAAEPVEPAAAATGASAQPAPEGLAAAGPEQAR